MVRTRGFAGLVSRYPVAPITLYRENLVGKALDTNKYFIITADTIGDRLTTAPSNSRAGPGMSFPHFLIREMVESQDALGSNRSSGMHAGMDQSRARSHEARAKVREAVARASAMSRQPLHHRVTTGQLLHCHEFIRLVALIHAGWSATTAGIPAASYRPPSMRCDGQCTLHHASIHR